MDNIVVNETPVRTSQNFNINDIKIDNVTIPEMILPFENVKLNSEGSNSKVTNYTTSIELVYGISSDFTKMLNEKANQKIKIDLNGQENNTEIEFMFNQENQTLLDDIQIETVSNTKATIVIKYKVEDDLEYFHQGVIRLHAEENTQINVIIVNFLNTKSNHFISIQNDLEANSKVNYTIVDFGGKNCITNYYSNLLGESSENTVNTIYLGIKDQLFDMNYIGELRGPKSNIQMDAQGALKDIAKKHFKGTIDFKKGCKKAKGDENEFCMLLSDAAKSIALPMLLCSEEDVEGNHASSAGKVGEKELFYMMSRGFELKEAMKLVVRAKFNHVISKIESETLREEILEEMDRRLDE